MTDQEKLYETLGELLYVVAKADGVIQDDERSALADLLKDHEWAKEITWSFQYEESKDSSIDDLYKKVMNTCQKIGPSPIYVEFIASMNTVAEASNGIDQDESKVINSFSADLIEKFKRDIEALRE